jgi:hypothetical protein
MAKCLVLKGFAFGSGKKPKQYQRGQELSVSGEALEFAKSNNLVKVLSGDTPAPEVEPELTRRTRAPE